jgi:parallel beta-helix repeat protein
LIITTVPFVTISKEVTTSVITVDDDGAADYSSIGEAINAASEGDTIYVHNGTYYEHLTIDKTLILQGEKPETTIIDGEQTGTIITITAGMLKTIDISGFTLQHSGTILAVNSFDSAIFSKKGATILLSNNIFIHHNISGAIIYGGMDHIINNNSFIDNRCYGLIMNSDLDSIITYNQFEGTGYGMYLSQSSNSKVTHNSFEGGYNINSLADIILQYSNNVKLKRNEFSNGMVGIFCFDSKNNENLITENNFDNSAVFVKTNLELSLNKGSLAQLLTNPLSTQTALSHQLASMLKNTNDEKGLTILPTQQTSAKTTWDANYWSDWNGRGYHKITGLWVFVVRVPFILIFPWMTFDKNPADTPYDIS